MRQSGEPEGRECSSGKHWGTYPRSKQQRQNLAQQTIVREGRFSTLRENSGFLDSHLDLANGNWEIERQVDRRHGYFSLFWVSSISSPALFPPSFLLASPAWLKPLCSLCRCSHWHCFFPNPPPFSPEARSGYLLLVWILSLFLIWLPAFNTFVACCPHWIPAIEPLDSGFLSGPRWLTADLFQE